MKSVVKPLSIITAVAYVGGIIVTAIYLYKLPTNLMESSGALDMETIKEVQPVLNQITFVVALAMVAGLAALVLQALSNANSNENVVFVEKFRDDSTSSQNASKTEIEEEQFDTSSLSQDVIEKIKSATAEALEPDKLLEKVLRTVCVQLEASQGAVYIAKEVPGRRFIEMRASFAFMKPDSQTVRYEFGEGLPGQVAKEGTAATIEAVPDGYIKILSGLGQATPKHLMLIPVKSDNKVLGVVEIASFTRFTKKHQEITQQAFTMLSKHFAKSSELINSSEELFEEFENKSQNA